MSPENLIIVAMVVFVLMFIGLALTALEFRKGAPRDQMNDHSKMKESPHGHVDD